MTGEPLSDQAKHLLAQGLIDRMALAIGDEAVVGNVVLIEGFFQCLRLLGSYHGVIGAVEHQERRANAVSRRRGRSWKAIARSNAAGRDGGGLQAVGSGRSEPDGDKAAHAVTVSEEALGIDLGHRAQQVEAGAGAAEVFGAGSVVIGRATGGGALAARTGGVGVIRGDADETPSDHFARLVEAKTFRRTAQAVADQHRGERAFAIGLKQDASQGEVAITKGPAFAIELKLGSQGRARIDGSVLGGERTGGDAQQVQKEKGHQRGNHGGKQERCIQPGAAAAVAWW